MILCHNKIIKHLNTLVAAHQSNDHSLMNKRG
jgi:hypothetical protein